MKINKCNRLVCNLYDKNDYVAHIRSLKQVLDYGIILKKVNKVMQVMLKKDLIHQVMKSTDYCLQERIKKWLN